MIAFLFVFGLAAIVAGVGLIYIPAAFIAAGVLSAGTAVALVRAGLSSADDEDDG